MEWKPFRHDGKEYDLSHLNDCSLSYTVKQQGEKPEIVYQVDVAYSDHCFSSDLKPGTAHDASLVYRTGRRTRLFEFRRYELSKQLPAIVEELLGRDCMHGKNNNYFTVALAEENGSTVDYDVFFVASKSSTKGRINLFIQSAYPQDRKKLESSRPIRFEIILFNALRNKT